MPPNSIIQAVIEDPLQFVGLMVAFFLILFVRKYLRQRTTKKLESLQPSVAQVTQIFVYPIKSCRGIEVTSSKINNYGFEYDRNWMVVRKPEESNGEYRFVTQRQFPKMALISPKFVTKGESKYMVLSAPSMQDIEILVEGKQKKEKKIIAVGVWKTTCRGEDEGEEVARWISNYLSADLRLVRIPSDHERQISEEFTLGGPRNLVGYADGYPFLIASQESLDCLNLHLKKNGSKSLPITRFRPNVVIKAIEQGEPFMEDSWKRIKIGDIQYRLVKKCTRCKLTTVDPDKGEFAGDEPLKTLSSFRQGLLEGKDEVCFGQNMCADQTNGFISVGMPIRVIE